MEFVEIPVLMGGQHDKVMGTLKIHKEHADLIATMGAASRQPAHLHTMIEADGPTLRAVWIGFIPSEQGK